MAQSEEDTFMEDVQGSQAGEPEAEVELEKKLFLVWPFWAPSISSNSTAKAGLTYLVAQLPGSSDTGASFEFRDENHTLGNALRFIIMRK